MSDALEPLFAALPARRCHVVVGLSGGVDSAVTAWLAREAGHKVTAVFMRNWAEDESGYCTSAADFQAARAVAEELEIPLLTADFSARYREKVFARFLDGYRAGRVPNPDLWCNREVKFGPFRDYAFETLGADALATGHYARTTPSGPESGADDNGPALWRAADDNKCQTYFLATVAREAFANVYFPLGNLPKPEVRRLATAAGLPNHRRADSTGICFIGERPFRDFLKTWLPGRPGEIITDTGQVVGRHEGLAYYTPGQRKGLGIGGVKGAPEAPWQVVGRDFARQRLIVSQDPDHPALWTREVATDGFSWLAPVPAVGARLTARLRHRQEPAPCWLARAHPGPGGGVAVVFDAPQRAAVAGQFLVLYDGARCLGGGEIAARAADEEALCL